MGRADSVLSPCGILGSNPGHQAWQQVPLPTELSRWPGLYSKLVFGKLTC